MTKSAREVALERGYKYLQSRLEYIGYHGWAHDYDGEIEASTLPPEPAAVPEGWLMWASGDGAFQRLCRNEGEVSKFFVEALFGTLENADPEEVLSYMRNFRDPDYWAGYEWHVRFEDGGIHALKLDLAAAPKPKHEECGGPDNICLVAEARGEHCRCQGSCAYAAPKPKGEGK